MDFYPEGGRRGGINNHSCLDTQGCIFTNEWFPSCSLCMYVMADTDRSVRDDNHSCTSYVAWICFIMRVSQTHCVCKGSNKSCARRCATCSAPLMWSDLAGDTSLNSSYLCFQSYAALLDCDQGVHCLTSPLINAWFTAGQQNTKKAKKRKYARRKCHFASAERLTLDHHK